MENKMRLGIKRRYSHNLSTKTKNQTPSLPLKIKDNNLSNKYMRHYNLSKNKNKILSRKV